MSYVRTPEHRELRRRLIQRWKPWEKSTGPKTAEGKRRSAMRGYKGGQREQARAIASILKHDAVTFGYLGKSAPRHII